MKIMELSSFSSILANSFLGIVILTIVAGPVNARGTCKLGEFRCDNGECIEKSRVCDSYRDCPSGIDEYVCTPKFRRGLCGYHRMRFNANKALGRLGQNVVSFLLGSGPKKVGIFQCQFGGCIPQKRVCDGNINCIGGSDEGEICENNSCLPGQFRCKYGACIPDWQMCNGRINCPDGSDETVESCKYVTCKENEFRCRYGGCIPKDRICDIKKHCADGSDEYDFLCLITRAKMVESWRLEGKLINEEQDRWLVSSTVEKERRRNTLTEEPVQHDETSRTTTTETVQVETTTSTPTTPKTTSTPTTPKTTSTAMSLDVLKSITDNTVPTDDLLLTSTTQSPIPEDAKTSDNSAAIISDRERSMLTANLETTTLAGSLDATSTISSDRVIQEENISSTTQSPLSTTTQEVLRLTECKLPPIPDNAEASISSCQTTPQAYFCRESTATVPPGVVVQYECDPGYILYGPPAITCKVNGNWSARPPECDPLIDVRWGLGSTLPNNFDPRCPALHPPRGVRVECLDPKNLSVKSCSEKQSPGIDAKFTCAPYYRPSGDLPAYYEKCNEQGKWTPGVHEQFTCVPDCGLSELPKTPYILNGQGTKRGQWPWHVAIYLRHKGELKYICGGALITEQSVLTSAHCVTVRGAPRDSSEFLIMLGKQHIALPDPDPFVQKRFVSKILVEDSFNHVTLDSDIAILALKDPAVLSYYVRPTCFPKTSNSLLEEYQLAPGSLGTVVGFGFTENGSLSQELRMVQLPVVSATDCTDSHGDFFASATRSTNYCAGYRNGTQVCNGDSGGGQYFRAIVRGYTRWYIQGLVSYGVPSEGPKSCASAQYAIFTRVGRYGDWIVKTLSRENLM